MLILAFDTATDLATSALVADGEILGERVTRPQLLLSDVDALVRAAGLTAAELTGIVVGTGPGSFTGTRIGLSVARGLGLALGLPVAGVSTLEALAAGAVNAFPVIDARRGEVFVLGPEAVRPEDVSPPPGSICVGSGALLYRDLLVGRGAEVAPDDSDLHVPRASLHASLATRFGPADGVEPVYVRLPDAQTWSA
ncbi:MAG: tRNA (adenosine(37)-N6)-threonylcarbamoyltransferase complex dimerization subunit type 1 TsaB [Thermoleophilia bacterium]